ncbi:MAG: hypothetical protein V2A61_01070 [Calditrichota bacterium]
MQNEECRVQRMGAPTCLQVGYQGLNVASNVPFDAILAAVKRDV